MRCGVVLLCYFVLVPVVLYAHPPPKGIDWKDEIQAGKTEASSRKVPIMMYVAGDNANSEALSQSMQDPKVVRMLRHFACVFVSQSHNLQKFQQSYVPWIGATPQTTHTPPVLIFGDPAGNPRQEYRVEGKSLKVEELLAHLEKVLRSLAPEEAKLATEESLKTMTLLEHCKRLELSLEFLEKNLSAEMLVQFQEEIRSALHTLDSLEGKLKRLKGGDAKVKAIEKLKELEKTFQKLSKYKGTEKEKKEYDNYIKKAREHFDSLVEIVKRVEGDKEVMCFKAVPRSKKVSREEEVKSALEKIEKVIEVSFERTEETVDVEGEKKRVSIFRVTCEKGKVSRSEIAQVLDKCGYEVRWVEEEKK
ncbi:MAG: hypothetical protein N2234_10355 [Planctomycetota bacterium]|nr:hypothetical protein [Planctomycetota bacterium]